MAESHFVRRCTCKDFIVAREGMEQRIVPTGMAVRDNEVKRHRNFSKKHFSGVAACGFRLVGHDGGAVTGLPSQCMLPGWGCCQVVARRIAAFAAVL
ncbi:MAG: hypothetical protein V8S90_03925 [Lachnospiraceae bacterium]